MSDLTGKRVTVMDLGLHGGAIGTIKWLHDQGAHVTVTDLKPAGELTSSLQQLEQYPDIEFVLGEHRPADFTETDMLIQNPAVPRTSRFLMLAKQAGVPIVMDSSLFFKYCPSRHIIGVTGSKGKTTTASAIAVLLKAHFPQAVAVGIDGVSPLGELPAIQANSPVIFELSSWRLEPLDAARVSPSTAVVTSLYRDHLNTYASYDDYIATKKIIIKYQTAHDRVLLNADDPLLQKWAPEVRGQLYWYTIGDLQNTPGIFVRDGWVCVVVAKGEPATKIMEWEKLPLHSQHERRNLLPAILLSVLDRIPIEIIKRELTRLSPLPHRLEVVQTLRDVTYVNDSAATMPDATIAALQAYHGKPLVLLLGGSDKELLFDELAEALKKATVRAIIFLPGTATARLKQAVLAALPARTLIHDAASMIEAVERAAAVAEAGDTVLLSPGATSFGLFMHEFDRGNQFRHAVLNL